MTKRKTKRNARRSRRGRDFKVSKDPMVRFAENGPLSNVHRMDVTCTPRQPFLFAIARDECTIFASWNIDWQFVFQKEMPADRQVHLRVIGADGVTENRVSVEPMRGMHYLTVSGFEKSYRVEIGYFQPFDIWHSVAMSDEVELPLHHTVAVADVDLATIPFHLRFEHLANILGRANDSPLARVVSGFQKRISDSQGLNNTTQTDQQILENLHLSLPDIKAAERDFRNIDTEKLARRACAMLASAGTSPARGFHADFASELRSSSSPISPR